MSSPAPAPQFTFGGYSTDEHALIGVGFWPRVAARLIDTVVHQVIALFSGFFIGIVIAIAAVFSASDPSAAAQRAATPGFTAFLLAIVGYAVYHTICEGLHGSTLGKLIMGQVVLHQERRPCGFRASLIRSLGYYVDGLVFGLVGYLKMKDSPQAQRHGDAWAHTVVCKRKDVPDQVRGAGRFIAALFLATVADAACLSMGVVFSLF
jgi:uncharacterized RDD family membrane protein YckC